MSGKPKILVIEDDEYVRFSLNDLLEENNYSVTVVSNGREGIKAAGKILPDLIICDIMMPVLNGFDVLKALSQNIKTAVIPFIFLTALSDVKDMRAGMSSGANDYIVKPYDASVLLNSIETRLKKVKAFKTSFQKINHVIEVKEEHKHYDKNLLFLENSKNAEFFKIEEIAYVEARNVYSCVYTQNGKSIVIRRTLKQWEEMLPEDFIRIHRSVIINLNCISHIEKISGRNYQIFVKGSNKTFNISQHYKNIIKKIQQV